MGILLENCLISVTGKIVDMVAKKSDLVSVKSNGSHPISKPKAIPYQ